MGMAVGHPQNLASALPGPALSQKLLAGINRKTAAALLLLRPDIAAGPYVPQPPAGGIHLTDQQRTAFQGRCTSEQATENDQQALISDQDGWRQAGHTDTLWSIVQGIASSRFMIDTTATTAESGSANQDSTGGEASGVNFTERYSEILGKVNATLDQVDWNQMGRIGKSIGILLAVIVAQVLIKGVLDTINLLPILPGLLELLGLIVVGQWSWKNLTTGEKRSAVVSQLQQLRQEYLG
jgi:hypothetical protein